MNIGDWMLTANERGNPDTAIDARHADGAGWTEGNDVVPLPHGKTYFELLLKVIDGTTAR